MGELLVPRAGPVRAAAGLICIALATTASTARARDAALPRLELHWDAPEGCMDREAARSAIEAAMGAAAAQAKTHAVVRVRIAQVDDADRWSADIWMYDETGGGERSFDGATCMQVAQATVMIVAFALDDARASEPADDAAQAAPAAHEPHDRTRFGVGVRARGDIGSLPALDAGMALVLEARYRRFAAELEGSAWLPQITYSGPVSGSGGEFALYTGGLRGCFDLLGQGSWSLGPCAGAEAGMTTGSGVGVTERRSSRVFWATGLFGAGVRFLGGSPLEVGLLAEAGVPFHRAAWQLDDFGPVFQPAPVIGRASIGLSYLFP